ncbi:lupus La protein homolog [Gigantopelta aegis]|uniref:lupus La protein homolog n=1 Tax=Gigantopelta aegis TaxID=1735272 RepID=UPI001B88D67D|nr:lupus La protein homolog [Gigantopelta aegis]
MDDTNGSTEKTVVQDESNHTPTQNDTVKKSAQNDTVKKSAQNELDDQSTRNDTTKEAGNNELDKDTRQTESDTKSKQTESVEIGDVSVSEEVCKKIVKQLEYYFGDVNLPRDRFLQDQIKADDGWIKIETLLTFNRLKKICDNIKSIAHSVKKSTSEVLEISDCLTKVRRSPQKPIPENTKERRTDISARSVYVKGFPLNCGIDELEEFFQTYGPVDSIFMKRFLKEKKTFKGSVIVTFTSKDDTEKFLKIECVKYKDTDENELEKMLKDDYYTTKQQQKAQLRNDEEERKKEEEETKEEEKKKLLGRITKGAILDLENIADNTSREDIRNFFSDFGQVAWVDFNLGDKKARVRFEGENGATLALEKANEANDDKIEINNSLLMLRVLEGEEELEHWQSIFSRKHHGRNKKWTQPFNKGKRKFKQGGHGKTFHRGDGEPHEKRSKPE